MPGLDAFSNALPPFATEDGTPTQRQIEQDVVSVNPSADSMESRG